MPRCVTGQTRWQQQARVSCAAPIREATRNAARPPGPLARRGAAQAERVGALLLAVDPRGERPLGPSQTADRLARKCASASRFAPDPRPSAPKAGAGSRRAPRAWQAWLHAARREVDEIAARACPPPWDGNRPLRLAKKKNSFLPFRPHVVASGDANLASSARGSVDMCVLGRPPNWAAMAAAARAPRPNPRFGNVASLVSEQRAAVRRMNSAAEPAVAAAAPVGGLCLDVAAGPTPSRRQNKLRPHSDLGPCREHAPRPQPLRAGRPAATAGEARDAGASRAARLTVASCIQLAPRARRGPLQRGPLPWTACGAPRMPCLSPQPRAAATARASSRTTEPSLLTLPRTGDRKPTPRSRAWAALGPRRSPGRSSATTLTRAGS